MNHYNEDNLKIVFVGTSLGAWFANKMAEIYQPDRLILINPSFDPKNSLEKYGVPENIRDQYDPIEFNANQDVVIGLQDEVIDFTNVDFKDATVYYVDGSHSFNGPEFKMITTMITRDYQHF